MRTRSALLLLVLAAAALAQNPVIDGMIDGAIIRRQLSEAEAARAAAERDRAIAASERQRVAARAADQGMERARMSEAITRTAQRFPDFDRHRTEIVRLVGLFDIGKDRSFTYENYLEGLYWVAKSASFSKTAETEVGVSQHVKGLLEDPEFHNFPIEIRRRVLKDIDPGFAALSPSEQESTLRWLGSKFAATQ